jgi:UDP-glucose 4-epimerase
LLGWVVHGYDFNHLQSINQWPGGDLIVAVLVTGAAGFIGSHVAEYLIKSGLEVIALDDLSGGFAENCPRGAEFVQGSVLDPGLLRKIFADHSIDHVFHLAAYAAEGLSHFIRAFNYTNNLVGSMRVLNEAIRADIKCFVFTSSIAVYSASSTPMREEAFIMPEDPYGIAKYAVELDLQAAHRMFGLNYVIFRPHNIYGERQQFGDRYRNVLGIFMNQLMLDQPMTIFGDGSQTRCFSYIDDVAPMIARAIHEPRALNQTFNIGADEPVTINDLATIVSEAMNKPRNVRHVEPRNEVQYSAVDHSKIARILDYRAKYSLRDGVQRMAEWATRVGPRKPQTFSNIEISKNLPGIWNTQGT